jgi:Predicted hydrolases or acyltransferases (alpha/beta hydrolase superfamily)
MTSKTSLTRRNLFTGSLALGVAATTSAPSHAAVRSRPVLSKTVKINGLEIFYREAGPSDAPVVLLLHGFPSSSHMFRNLMLQLAQTYRVIAPDYPGFGYSAAPGCRNFLIPSKRSPRSWTVSRLRSVRGNT